LVSEPTVALVAVDADRMTVVHDDPEFVECCKM
jgi:hypothetical protein